MLCFSKLEIHATKLCTICKEPLKKLIEDKTVQFNEGLLKNGNTDTDDDDLSESDTNDDTTEGNNEVTDTNTEQYYTSGVWEQKVDNILTGIGSIDQPKHAIAQASPAHNQAQSSTVEIHSLTQYLLYVLINPSSSGRVIS